MIPKKIIPASEREIEIFVSNSRFIASLKPTFSVDEAKVFISEIKEKYPDATHHVPVYVIGHKPVIIEHCSDDGEPVGTAGKPALSVLRGSKLGDITIVITRYFGGTKLGTGGLVRAYSDAVRTVLNDLPLAKKVKTSVTSIQIPYNLFDQIQRLIEQFNGIIISQTFEAEITLHIQLMYDQFEKFQNSVIELSRGQITPEISSTNDNSIFPLK